MNSQRLKLISAAAGVGAVVAMGTLTATLADDSSSTTIVSDPGTEASLGETTTIEKAASTPETTMAVPEHTAEPPDGFGP
jgi:hypothetical protein